MMLQLVFVLPLGPNDIERFHYTIESIRKYCEYFKVLVILDGVEQGNSFPTGEDIEYHTAHYLSKGHWGAIWLNQMLGFEYAMKHLAVDEQSVFVKIDADALVIKDGFHQRANALFASRTSAGLIGQVYSDVTGSRLLNLGWENYYKKTVGLRGLKLFLSGQSCVEGSSTGQRFRAWKAYRKIVRANPAPHHFGIGGCYCLSFSFLKKFVDLNLCLDSPFRFTPRFGEDAIMGLTVGSIGFDLLDDSMDGGLMAVGGMYSSNQKCFRVSPLDIAARNHTVIHPFKYGYKDDKNAYSESELVEKLLRY